MYLILTSSKGTTTNDSVAPAEQPVRIDIRCVIFDSPVRFKNVLPQKSLAALAKYIRLGHYLWSKAYNLTARLGASRRRGGPRPIDQKENQSVLVKMIFVKLASVQPPDTIQERVVKAKDDRRNARITLLS
jgi:hypothetical protein